MYRVTMIKKHDAYINNINMLVIISWDESWCRAHENYYIFAMNPQYERLNKQYSLSRNRADLSY